jgi:phosphate-selective porin OprO and OprP
VRQGTAQDTVQNRAWQVSTSYVLTGEPAAQRIVPRRALDPKSGGWGAVEVTARYHTLELDKDFLSRWSTSAIGVEWARAWDTGVNWYLNRGVKVSAEYQEVRFRGGASDGERPTERGVLTRVQVGF